jgi:predicted dehydrogenase
MKKIGVGFVGSGWMGSVELERLAEREDVEVLGLFEPNAERGRDILAKVGLPADRLVGSYETLLGNPGVAAVFLASPNAFHGAQAIAAMKAGKHVFCEKPCATDFREFREQIELSRANPGLVTFVDYILYFDTMEKRLREMVGSGAFGTVTQVQVNYRHPVNIVGDKTWKLKRALVGDAIGMGVIHSVFAMLNLMAPQARPAGVYATSLGAQVRGFEPDPVWNILIRFDNGATGFCFGNIDNGNGYDAYHNLYGTEGGFVFDSGLERDRKVRYWSAQAADGKWIHPLDAPRCKAEGIESLAWPAETTTPDSGDVVNHQTRACVGHFIECVKSGTQSPLSFVNSAIVAETGWAAMMSAGLGREVRMPLDWKESEAFFEAEKKS